MVESKVRNTEGEIECWQLELGFPSPSGEVSGRQTLPSREAAADTDCLRFDLAMNPHAGGASYPASQLKANQPIPISYT